MSDELKLRSGTRMQIAYDVPPDKEPNFSMMCTFYKAIDESAFLISVPMRDGKPLLLDEHQKLLIRYTMADSPMIVVGYPDDEVKEGIRRYWKIRRVTDHRQFFKRADERVKVALRVKYRRLTALPGEESMTDEEDGMTLDISAGGMALYLNDRMDVGELCSVTLPRVGTTPEGASIPDIAAVVCWMRDAPRGSIYRRICGLQYRLDEGTQRQPLQNYVANVKKKYRV
ncbi:MAG: PilZ domain-containing protein [Oscillospiraceae bacterium]|nr:PilZ domain-containing protein [Oscillospiraceae bacterium]